MNEDAIVALLQAEPDRAFHQHEIFKRLSVSPKKEKGAKRTLKSMVRRGVIERLRGRTYRLSRKGQEVEGMVQLDERGRTILWPSKGKKKDALPILPEQSDLVRTGQMVRGEIVAGGRRGRMFIRIVEIQGDSEERLVGKFRRVGRAMYVEVDLDGKASRRNLTNVTIPDGKANEATDGELVELSITSRGEPGKSAPVGLVVQVLGQPGERSTEMKRLLIEHNLDHGFPEEVEREAQAFGDVPTEEDMKGRRDLRDLNLVTIDGETAKDFDDAVCAVRDKSGYKLYVAIADVSHYVRVGRPLDEEAFARGTSTYLTDRAIPMLPEALSNGLCSLNPKVDRLCMVAELSVDRTGHVRDARFERAVMRSKARLTYTRVARALEGEPDEECASLLPTLLILSRVSAKLFERRLKRGAIDLDLPEAVIDFGEDGIPTGARPRARNDAHRLIEELMLAANEAVARYFVERGRDTLFRIHEDPDPDKLALFGGLCAQLGLDTRISEEPTPGEVARILEALSEQENGKALHGLLLRSLKQARYDAECKGHYGLASEAYLHFTSPIRRYPDLIVHRLLKQSIDKKEAAYDRGKLQTIATACSEAERRAMLAERDSMDLDRALIAKRHLGEELEGTITGVAHFGLFVIIDEPFVEGMIPVQTLPEDFYELDEFGAMLIGSRTKRTFALGDRVEVIIAAASISRRKVEMRLSKEANEPSRRTPRRAPRRKKQKGRRVRRK